MPRSFDITAAYDSSVEVVLAAFADEQYWLARLAESGADEAILDELAVSADGAILVRTTQVLHRNKLPGVVAQFHRGDLRITRREQWSAVSDGTAGATVSGAIPGAPVSLNGDAMLAPLDVGSARLALRASVDVRVPLVGSKIEKMLGGQLTELMQIEQRFTTEWIAGRR